MNEKLVYPVTSHWWNGESWEDACYKDEIVKIFSSKEAAENYLTHFSAKELLDFITPKYYGGKKFVKNLLIVTQNKSDLFFKVTTKWAVEEYHYQISKPFAVED